MLKRYHDEASREWWRCSYASDAVRGYGLRLHSNAGLRAWRSFPHDRRTESYRKLLYLLLKRIVPLLFLVHSIRDDACLVALSLFFAAGIEGVA